MFLGLSVPEGFIGLMPAYYMQEGIPMTRYHGTVTRTCELGPVEIDVVFSFTKGEPQTLWSPGTEGFMSIHSAKAADGSKFDLGTITEEDEAELSAQAAEIEGERAISRAEAARDAWSC